MNITVWRDRRHAALKGLSIGILAVLLAGFGGTSGCSSAKNIEEQPTSSLVGKWMDRANPNSRTEVEFYEDGLGILTLREPSGMRRGDVVVSRFWFKWEERGNDLTIEYSGAEKAGQKLSPPPFEKLRIRWTGDGGVDLDKWRPKGAFYRTD